MAKALSEHVIRNDLDLQRHVDYIHFRPGTRAFGTGCVKTRKASSSKNLFPTTGIKMR